MKSSGDSHSHLFFNLQKLFHRHLFVLREPAGAIHAPKTPATAVLVEEDVIEFDFHKGRSQRCHGIMALRNTLLSWGTKKRGQDEKRARDEASQMRDVVIWSATERTAHFYSSEHTHTHTQCRELSDRIHLLTLTSFAQVSQAGVKVTFDTVCVYVFLQQFACLSCWISLTQWHI